MSGRPHARSSYFVSLPVDLLCIGGGSLLVYPAMRLWAGTTRTELAWTIAGYLVWVVNWPHFSATNYRLYGARAHVRQYPLTAALSPIIVLAGILGSFASPALVAPWFIKVFLVWSPYHFSGQTIGISLLYARRSGWKVGAIERIPLAVFVYGTFLLGSARAEVGLATGQYFGVPYPTFGLPPSVPTAIEAIVWVSAIVLALVLLRRAVVERRPPPLLFLAPSISQLVWFVPGGRVPNYAEFVPLFHSLQYLLIAWSMQLKDKADRSGVSPGGAFVARETLRWYVVNVAGGAILFALLPWVAARAGVDVALASAIVIAAVQIHHFFVDGVIWKLRTDAVASPLLVNIPQMIREAPLTSALPAAAPASPREAA